jgi:hypothetical protein
MPAHHTCSYRARVRPAEEHTTYYAIRVAGHLGAHWAVLFDGMSITPESGGTTLLRGALPDQAALHGVLNRLRDSGLPLISLTIDDPRSMS